MSAVMPAYPGSYITTTAITSSSVTPVVTFAGMLQPASLYSSRAAFESHDVIRWAIGLLYLSVRRAFRFLLVLRRPVDSGPGFTAALFCEPAIIKKPQCQEYEQHHPEDKIVNEHDTADQFKHGNTRRINSPCKPISELGGYRSFGQTRCCSLPGTAIEAGKHRQKGISHFLAGVRQAMGQAPVDFRMHACDLPGARPLRCGIIRRFR